MSRVTGVIVFLTLTLSLSCVLCTSPFDTLSIKPIASSIATNDEVSSSIVIDNENVMQPQHQTSHQQHTLQTTTSVPTTAPTSAPTSSPSPVMDSEERAFVTLINDYRVSNGLVPLQLSISLTKAAEWMAQDMAEKSYFSHTDSLGRDPFRRMAAFGYPQTGYRGENIAAGNSLASGTFNQWRNSAGHNANMLNGNYRIMGIARYYKATSPYRWYWVNKFGSVVVASDVLP